MRAEVFTRVCAAAAPAPSRVRVESPRLLAHAGDFFVRVSLCIPPTAKIMSSSSWRHDFLTFCVECDAAVRRLHVVGRYSPYFFNAGLFLACACKLEVLQSAVVGLVGGVLRPLKGIPPCRRRRSISRGARPSMRLALALRGRGSGGAARSSGPSYEARSSSMA